MFREASYELATSFNTASDLVSHPIAKFCLFERLRVLGSCPLDIVSDGRDSTRGRQMRLQRAWRKGAAESRGYARTTEEDGKRERRCRLLTPRLRPAFSHHFPDITYKSVTPSSSENYTRDIANSKLEIRDDIFGQQRHICPIPCIA